MPALDAVLQQKLQLLAAKSLKRTPIATEPLAGALVKRMGKTLVSFSGNDYLGLARHPRVIEAVRRALEKYGAGAGASRLVTGNYPLYDELEATLTAHKETEAACVFGSGYLANLGTIPALVGAGDLIIADKFIHACMYDAARLSGATFMRFAHNNMAHCRMLLEANRHEHQNCLILTETVFSMDGDRAPIAELQKLAQEFGSWLMVDSAHDLYSRPLAPDPRPPIQMGTLSKAIGSYGGYVCGSHILVGYLKATARSLIYSTGLPPAAVAAALESLHVIKEEPELTEKPLVHARYFTTLMGMKEAQSAIVPLILKDNDKALAASALLEEKGFLVSAIRPPTVPEHTARLRFAFSALHEKSQIDAVVDVIKGQGWV